MAELFIKSSRNRQILRYAVGATVAVGIAMWFQWQLAFVLPLLALGFFGTGPGPDIRTGFLFVATIAVAALVGIVLTQQTLILPTIHIAVSMLLLFHIFYTNHPKIRPDLKVWLIVVILLIPNVGLLSKDLAIDVAVSLVVNAALVILLIWTIYLLIPYRPEKVQPASKNATPNPVPPVPTQKERFNAALQKTLVLLPLYLVFFYFELTSNILILIFVAMLSMQPGFAKDFKAGKALVIGNLMGGLAAILAFEVLVIVPEYSFFLLLVLIAGLIAGQNVFGGKPSGALYGMAYSTFLLVICSVTGDGAKEADSKVWIRVLQIMTAVVYVVVTFGVIQRFRKAE